jgi:hypothetical protein
LRHSPEAADLTTPSCVALREHLLDNLRRLLQSPPPDLDSVNYLRAVAQLTKDGRIAKSLDSLQRLAESGSFSSSAEAMIEWRLAIVRALQTIVDLESSSSAQATEAAVRPEVLPNDHAVKISAESTDAIRLGRVAVFTERSVSGTSTDSPEYLRQDRHTPKVPLAAPCLTDHLRRRSHLVSLARSDKSALRDASFDLLAGSSSCDFIDGLYGFSCLQPEFIDAGRLAFIVVERCGRAHAENPLAAIPRDLTRLLRKDRIAGGRLAEELMAAARRIVSEAENGDAVRILARAASVWGPPYMAADMDTDEKSAKTLASVDRHEALAQGVELRFTDHEDSAIQNAYIEAFGVILDVAAASRDERLRAALAILAGSSSAKALSYLFELRDLAGAMPKDVMHPSESSPDGLVERAIRISSGLEACFARWADHYVSDRASLEDNTGLARSDDHSSLLARALAGDLASARRLLFGESRSIAGNDISRTAQMLLTSQHSAVRRMAASLMSSSSPDRTLAYAAFLCGSRHSTHRIAGISLLENYDLETVKPYLLSALRSKDPWVVHSAVTAASSVGRGSKDQELADAVLQARMRCAGGIEPCASALFAIGAPKALGALASLRIGDISRSEADSRVRQP